MSTHRLLLAPLGSLNLELDSLASGVSAHDLGVELELQSLLLQNLLELLSNLSIHTRTDSTKVLYNSDLGSQSRPDRTKLETDDTTSDDDHLQ